MLFLWIIPFGAMIMLAVAASFIDVEHRIIPDALNFPAMVVGAVFWTVQTFIGRVTFEILLMTLLYGFAVWGVFYFLSYLGAKIFKADALGLGDVKFLTATAFLLGPGMILEFFTGLLIASLSGFLFGVVSALIKKQSLRKSTLPFGPFLAFGMLLAMFIPAIK